MPCARGQNHRVQNVSNVPLVPPQDKTPAGVDGALEEEPSLSHTRVCHEASLSSIKKKSFLLFFILPSSNTY